MSSKSGESEVQLEVDKLANVVDNVLTSGREINLGERTESVQD